MAQQNSYNEVDNQYSVSPVSGRRYIRYRGPRGMTGRATQDHASEQYRIRGVHFYLLVA